MNPTLQGHVAFCNARFLARSSSSDLSRLHSVYFFAQGMCSQPILGRVSRQVCAVARYALRGFFVTLAS